MRAASWLAVYDLKYPENTLFFVGKFILLLFYTGGDSELSCAGAQQRTKQNLGAVSEHSKPYPFAQVKKDKVYFFLRKGNKWWNEAFLINVSL